MNGCVSASFDMEVAEVRGVFSCTHTHTVRVLTLMPSPCSPPEAGAASHSPMTERDKCQSHGGTGASGSGGQQIQELRAK